MRKSTWLAVTMALLAANSLAGCGQPASTSAPEAAKPNANSASMPTNVTPNAPDTAPFSPAQPNPQAVPGWAPAVPGQAVAVPAITTSQASAADLTPYALPKEGPIYSVQGGDVVPLPIPVAEGVSRVAFQSCRFGGGGESDIFVYDFVLDTVLALPAINTPAAEVNPEISANGRFLVYQTNVAGNWDIRMFDLQSLLINTLPGLNTPSDETQPDCSDTGMIVFVVNDCVSQTFEMLRLYDGMSGDTYIVPVRLVSNVTWPSISADGSTIAFGAFPIGFGTQDIYMYRIGEGLGTPPFVNTAFNDYNPELSADGSSMLFVSDRNGSEDIFMLQADGFLNNMVFANTPYSDEQEPRFLDDFTVIYQTTGGGPVTLRLTGINSGLIDTLPIASAGGVVNAQLRSYLPNAFDPFPGSPFFGGGPDDCFDCGLGGPGFPYPDLGYGDGPGYGGPGYGGHGPGPGYGGGPGPRDGGGPGHGPGPGPRDGGPGPGPRDGVGGPGPRDGGGGPGPRDGGGPGAGPGNGGGSGPGPDRGDGPRRGPNQGGGAGPNAGPGPDRGGSGPIVPPMNRPERPTEQPKQRDVPKLERREVPTAAVVERPTNQVHDNRRNGDEPRERPQVRERDGDDNRGRDKDDDKDKGGKGRR